MSGRRITQKEVAERAGVAQATVSLVLNGGRDKVTPKRPNASRRQFPSSATSRTASHRRCAPSGPMSSPASFQISPTPSTPLWSLPCRRWRAPPATKS
ncbi:LacI family DNA-binding transcriptional regulator [Rhizobium sp. BG4]|uniref:LacI family DNA-binding transcriptional regulator n=1 Tax=Rhizobium sp. BG4 TaxID=2613770 RepID=UPI001FF02615|nr:LacI family DNA-binding transcriptional regulator [Rhizobium sp. BG4]